MKISDLIRMGLRNLSRRKARTALTVVGVVIGTISIVVMISIGIGMNTNFQKTVMELGSLTTITIRKNAEVFDKDGNYVNSKEQKMDDNLVNKIKQIEHVKVATPVIVKQLLFYAGKHQNFAQINAMDYTTFGEFGFPNLVSGSMPNEENKNVFLIGADIMNNFYNPYSRNYTTKVVDIERDRVTYSFNAWQYELDPKQKEKKLPLKSYGIMEKSNGEYDRSCYMDLSAFKTLYKDYTKTLKAADKKKAETSLRSYEQIKINVDNIKNMTKVQDEITALGYTSESLMMYFAPMQQTSKMLQIVLGAVGAVAMLVSAISIANTMVMSIYERTKEIGVMKVLGCVITDIKKLFLFEAGIIGLLGGIIGVSISYIASFCINKFGAPVFAALMSGSMGMGMGQEASKFSIIPIWLPLLAAGFSMLVGIISGYYPANRATKISAIEAMKSEG